MIEKTGDQVIRVLGGINEILAEDWDACAGPDDPFCSHAFLAALEESGSVSLETGWLPHHIALENGANDILAVAPLYLKNHSYGEYVFDWAWADALHRAGGKYYPKLQLAIPFTPVTGRRFLIRQNLSTSKQREIKQTMLSGLIKLAEKLQVSSFHITFPSKEEWDIFGQNGLLKRTDRQFHWINNGFVTFEDFLTTLSSRKRKGIRKERRTVLENNIVVHFLTGEKIKKHHWDSFFSFYQNTADKKWGQAYLNRSFFLQIGKNLGKNLLLVMAEKEGRFVGGALNLIGKDALFGRYWGCLEEFKFLHFEICYYRSMDFAIKNCLRRVEAGAQGHHKLQRGYLPSPTYSAHWIANDAFKKAIAHYLEEETRAINGEIKSLNKLSPFKKPE